MIPFPDLLRKELEKELPGTDVQWQMASSDRMIPDYPRQSGNDARRAAVLVLLFPSGENISTLLMQRPDYDGVHGGQISFPGGKAEPGDANLVNTALREANEETGIDTTTITILGKLTPLFIWVSNTIVTPVVGWTASRPPLDYRSEEVSFLFEVPLNSLMDNSIIREKPVMVRGRMITVRYFDYDGHLIWGATSMMLNELLFIIRKSGLLNPGINNHRQGNH